MKTEIIELKLDDGINIHFKNLDYIDDFDLVANIIEKNINVKLIEYIDGIWSMYRTYEYDDITFQLMYHEDMGNCLRLPLKRDHRYDKEGYDLLRIIGNKIAEIINSKRK